MLYRGDSPLSNTGKKVSPTFTKLPSGEYEIGIKFGGAFVKLNGEKTHYTVPADKFETALMFLKERTYAGDFQPELDRISASISTRLRGNSGGAPASGSASVAPTPSAASPALTPADADDE